MEYFIEKNGKPVGPYDLMSMIRKVRNNAINTESIIIVGSGGTPTAAFEIPELREIFDESGDVTYSLSPSYDVEKYSLSPSELLSKGLGFFKSHQNISLIAGLLLLLVVFGNFIIYSVMGKVLFVIISSIWNYFMLSLLQIIILRKTRMQLASNNYVIKTIKRYGLQLLLCSLILGFSTLLVPLAFSMLSGSSYPLILILFPGSLLMMVFFYAPIIIVDQGVGAVNAFGQSISFMKKMGGENFAILYTLLLINFIAAAFFILPVLVTIPITFGALSEVYDEYYNQY